MTTYTYFIGIDVSKDSFEVCLHADIPQKSCSFSNNSAGFAAFCNAYAQFLPQALIVLEATGHYEHALLCHLLRQGCSVHRASGYQTACFARSLSPHRKTDRSDAYALSCYAKHRAAELRLACVPDENQETLEALAARRDDVMAMKKAEQQRLQQPRYEKVRHRVQHLLELLCEELSEIEDAMDDILREDTYKQEAMRTMQTVCGVGKRVAMVLLVSMPELGQLTRRQAASLAGVAPHPKDSGKYQGYRATRGGRAAPKRALFMAAMAASRTNSDIGNFYKRMIQNGKKPIVALIATARKIITIINARLRENNALQPDYTW